MAFRGQTITKEHVNLVARIVAGAIPDGDPAFHKVAYGSLKEPVRADADKQFAFIYVLHNGINVSRTIPIEDITLPSSVTLTHTDTTKNAIKVTFSSGLPDLTEQLKSTLGTLPPNTIPVIEETRIVNRRARSVPRQRPAGGAPSPTAAAASPRRPRSSSVTRMRPRLDSPPPRVTVPASAPSPFRAAAARRSSSVDPRRRQDERFGIADPRGGKPPRARSRTTGPRSASPPSTPDWRATAAEAATPEDVRAVKASFAHHLQRPVYFWHDELTRIMKDATLISSLNELQSTLRCEAGKEDVSFKSLQSGISELFTKATDRAHGALEEILKLINNLPAEQHASCVAKFMEWQFADMAKADLSRPIQSALTAKTDGASAAAPAPDGRK